MSRGFAPIIDVVPSAAKRNWGLEVYETLEAFENIEDFTFTTRIIIPESDQAAVKAKLLEHEGTADLVALLEENGWNVSFLIDGW